MVPGDHAWQTDRRAVHLFTDSEEIMRGMVCKGQGAREMANSESSKGKEILRFYDMTVSR